ncbi:CDP-glycerol glycerophosphotransferase family protein [Flindersiella endophytica]
MRTVSVTERVPAPDLGRVPLALTGLLVLADLVLLVSAFLASAWLLLGSALVLAVAEVAVAWRAPFSGWTLDRLAGGAPVRLLLQGIALVVFVERTDAHDRWEVWSALGVLLIHLSRLAGSGLAEVYKRQRKMPMVTRGLDLGPLTIPEAPPPWLVDRAGDMLSWPMLLFVIGAAVGSLTGLVPVLIGSGILALLVIWAGDLVLARAVLAMRAVPRSRFLDAVRRALVRLDPEVVLYFASGADTVYQLQMWIEPLEQLDRPVLLILRDRETFRLLGPTKLPVLCVEHGNVLMGLDLPALRLALYPSHAVGNLHLLRRRGVVHAFVGHGDSDKPVTTNPFLKAYDEIWVSGPASRERLLSAELGVDDRRIVEIGRPQLDALAAASAASGGDRVETRIRVLYAPTWEGYDDEPGQTSVGPAGVELIRRLVAEPDVRLLYRPHPLLGVRDPAVRRAHHEILALLGNPAVAQPAGGPDPYGRARDELEVAGVLSEESRTELVAARSVWARRYLNEHPGHVLVSGPQFPLYECLAETDVLLCDVSSVISEFLVTQKPYGVTNPGGLSVDDFAVRYPSSRGGYLMDADGHGLTALLTAARGGDDPAAAERVGLRARLLGSAEPPATARLREAIRKAIGE